MTTPDGLPDFLATEIGLLFGGGDPDWLAGLPADKRVKILAYQFARRTKEGGLWSLSGMSGVDLAYLLSEKKKPGDDADPLARALDMLDD